MIKKDRKKIKKYLDEVVDQYNRTSFIKSDPISLPHRYLKKQDQEIAGFFAATFAWGQRKTIIQKTLELMLLMDDAPHDFIVHHQEKDRKRLMEFKHRTFQTTDTLYFVEFLKQFYQSHDSLEDAFIPAVKHFDVKMALEHFHQLFFSLPYAPDRTKKHIATPVRKSTCKRLNMYLRWMCRRDDCGVDLGIWQRISPAMLMIPLDLHVERTARALGLLTRKQRDWKAVEEITNHLRILEPADPVKYDFALFGLSVLQKDKPF